MFSSHRYLGLISLGAPGKCQGRQLEPFHEETGMGMGNFLHCWLLSAVKRREYWMLGRSVIFNLPCTHRDCIGGGAGGGGGGL